MNLSILGKKAEVPPKIEFASQWQLTWWRFKKHKLALTSGFIVFFIYFIALFAQFIAPFSTERKIPKLAYAPPQTLQFWDENNGEFYFDLFVYDYSTVIDTLSLKRTFTVNRERKIPVGFLLKGNLTNYLV